MFRTRRGDEEHIYSTVKRVVNCVWEERKGSEAKRGCSSLVMLLKSRCQTEIINTILFNKKNSSCPCLRFSLHIEKLSGDMWPLHVVHIEKL